MKIRILKQPNKKAFGGNVAVHGGDFATGLTQINNGGTHEQSPYEGVPMGYDNEGTPNLVEEGETIYNDYVFSNRLTVPEYKEPSNGDKFQQFEKVLNKYKGKTYSDAAKKAEKDSGVDERPTDVIARRGFESILEILAQSQEQERDIQNYPDRVKEIKQYTPEEYQQIKQQQEQEVQAQQEAMQQQMQAQQQQQMSPEDQAMQQAIQEQQMQQMSPEQQAMMQQQMMQQQPQMAYGGQLYAEGGDMEQVETTESTVTDMSQEQSNTSGTEEAPQESMTEWELGTSADEMSTSELNAMVDKLYNYAKENKDRELLKRARKARRGTRDDKEEFVDDAREDIQMQLEEQQQQQQELEAQQAQEQQAIEQQQQAQMQSVQADAGAELDTQDGGYQQFANEEQLSQLPQEQTQQQMDNQTAMGVIQQLANSQDPKYQILAQQLYQMLSSQKGNAQAKQYIAQLLQQQTQQSQNTFAYGGDTKDAKSIIDYVMHLGKWKEGKYFNTGNAIKVAQGLIDSGKINIHDIIAILYNIGYESGFNPNAKNKRSTARGLVQWLAGRHPKNWSLDDQIQHIIKETTTEGSTYYLGEGHNSEEEAINWATRKYEAPEKHHSNARISTYKANAKTWKPTTSQETSISQQENPSQSTITRNNSPYMIDSRTGKPLEIKKEDGSKVKITGTSQDGNYFIGEDGKAYEVNKNLDEVVIIGNAKREEPQQEPTEEQREEDTKKAIKLAKRKQKEKEALEASERAKSTVQKRKEERAERKRKAAEEAQERKIKKQEAKEKERLAKSQKKQDKDFSQNLKSKGYTIEQYMEWLRQNNLTDKASDPDTRQAFLNNFNLDDYNFSNSHLTKENISNLDVTSKLQVADALGLDMQDYVKGEDILTDKLDKDIITNAKNKTIGQLTSELTPENPLKGENGDYSYLTQEELNNSWKRDYNTYGYYDSNGRFVKVDKPTGNENSRGNTDITFVGTGDWFKGNDEDAKAYEKTNNYINYYKALTRDALNGDEQALQRLYDMGEQSKGKNGENRFFKTLKDGEKPTVDKLKSNALDKNIDNWDENITNDYTNKSLLYQAMFDAQKRGASVVKHNHLASPSYQTLYRFNDSPEGQYLNIGNLTHDQLTDAYDISSPMQRLDTEGNPIEGSQVYTLSIKKTPNFKPVQKEQEDPDDDKKQLSEFPEFPNTPNYIKAGLFGAQALANALTPVNYSNADTLLNTAKTKVIPYTIGFKPIGDYLKYNPYDYNYIANQQLGKAAAIDRAIMNNANGNQGARVAGLLANNYNTQIGLGNTYLEAMKANNDQRAKVTEFNRGTNQFNSEGFLKADMANQDAIMKARLTNQQNLLEGTAKAMAMRQALEDQKNKTLSQNLTGLVSAIDDITRTNWQNKAFKYTTEHNMNPGFLFGYKDKKGSAFEGPLFFNR